MKLRCWVAFCIWVFSFSALADTIIDLRQQKSINQSELIHQLTKSEFILLGELHDNPHHHERRGQIITAVKNQSYAVVAEYLLADRMVTFSGTTLDSLERSGFSPKAWPWKLYQPLFDAIRVSNMRLYGSNLDRSISKQVFSKGSIPANMDTEYQKSSLDQEAKNALEKDLIDGHCGKLPNQYLDPMFRIQRLTDISMAQVMMRHAPAILLAGNGHVRKDYGVPQVLRSLQPASKQVSIGFIEEDRWNSKKMAELIKLYDFIWVTPRIERTDPCATLHFGKSESSR